MTGDKSRTPPEGRGEFSTDSWPVLPPPGGAAPSPAPDDSTRGATTAPAAAPAPAGAHPARLGRFEIRRIIGRGGMGIVYEAWDPDCLRRVAVKTLHTGDAPPDGTALERFLREARSAARLRHPGIVTVHDVGEDAGRHFLVMEFVEGRSFDRCLRGAESWAEFSLRRRVEILRDVAAALGEAHAKGIIHRDVKPSNVLIADDGRALLTDFGLAGETQAGDLERLTLAGVVLGTPQYVSPEQASGGSRRAVPASDVYSLGVVLYRAVTGRLPFEGKGPEVIEKALFERPAPPSAANPGVSADLEAVCLKCLEKDPEARYPDGRALAEELTRCLEGQPVLARAVAAPPAPPAARRGRLAWIAATIAVAGVAATWGIARLAGGSSATPSAGAGERAALVFHQKSAAPDSAPQHALQNSAAEARRRAELARLLDPGRAAVPRAAAAILRTAGWESEEDAVQAALASAEQATRQFPDSAEAWMVLASLHTIYGDLVEGERCCREALRLEPGAREPRVALAHHLVSRALLELAFETIQDVRADTPAAQALRHEAAGLLAQARAAAGESAAPTPLDDAVAAWTAGDAAATTRACEIGLAADSPHVSEAIFNILLASGATGETRRQSLDRAVAAAPGLPLARIQRALDNLLRGHYPDALADADAAVRVSPRLAEAHCARGCVLALAGHLEDSLAAFARAIELDPRLDVAYSRRGLAHLRAGRTPAALADFESALALRDDRPWLWLESARTRSTLLDDTRALLDFDRALRLLPPRASLFQERGHARFRAGADADALADFNQAIALDPELDSAWYGRGLVHLRAGRHEEAETDFSRSLQITPEASLSWGYRGLCRLRLHRGREALEDFNEAFRQTSPTSTLHVNRAGAHLDLGDAAAAEADFRAAIRLEPDLPEAWLGLALALLARGDRPGAGEAAEAALRHAPAGWGRKAEAEQVLGRARSK